MGTYISKIRVKQKNFYNSYGNHERLGPGKKKVKFGLTCERKLIRWKPDSIGMFIVWNNNI